MDATEYVKVVEEKRYLIDLSGLETGYLATILWAHTGSGAPIDPMHTFALTLYSKLKKVNEAL